MRQLRVGVALLLAAGGSAGAQTMLDQEQRLIEIHCLLLDLPPVQAPGPLRPLQLAVGLEGVTVPPIDGTTGAKRQITASDHTPLFPRPRLMLGLPAPESFRTFVGIAIVPPLTLFDVSTSYFAGEAGIAYTPGALSIGVRAHAVYAFTRSPVTDPSTRDTLETFDLGAELAAGFAFDLGWANVTPYAGVGVVHLHGSFTVTSDGVVLTGDAAVVAAHVGVRLLAQRHWDAAVELDAYPGRLVHTNFRVSYVFDLM